jgi:5'-nucleotidase
MKTTNIIKIGLIVLTCCLVGWCLGMGIKKARQSKPTLTILHSNDTHSQMEPIRTGPDAGLGGLLERAAFVDSVRRADGRENVLLLHAGDFCQGTTYFSEFRGTVEVQALNAMDYDAVTLGNHEFDNGLEGLGEMLSGVVPPVVVCNFDFSPFEAGKYIKPYVIVEKAGRKIGIIGVVCSLKALVSGETADRLPEYDMIPTVQKYADLLRPQCDMVIALTHLGYTEHSPGDMTDPKLCAATRNIDLFVGGHSHTYLEDIAWEENLDGVKIPIVTSYECGAYVGQMHWNK